MSPNGLSAEGLGKSEALPEASVRGKLALFVGMAGTVLSLDLLTHARYRRLTISRMSEEDTCH